MPGYKVHLLVGFMVYLAIVHCIQIAEPSASCLIQGLIFCLLGALFPDIDIKSKGQKIFYMILFVFLAVLIMQKKYCLFAVSTFLGLVPLLVRHRGLFHYIWFLIAMACAFSLIVKSVCAQFEQMMLNNVWFFLAGSISHVLLDRMWSYSKKRLGAR